jgi:AraC family transcriptional regulator
MFKHLGWVLDDSKVSQADGHDYTGAAVEQLRLAGARVSRIMHPPGQRIDAHRHDWPVLTLFRLGGYREEADDGATIDLDGPSVVFHPARAAHADEIGDRGLETLSMTFDPVWLSREAREALPLRTHWRLGGVIAGAARALASAWLAPNADDATVRAATSQFMLGVARRPVSPPPSWGARLVSALDTDHRTETLARTLSLHPAWLARAYRAWRGEGIADTLRRRRVERATLALRSSADTLAEVALASGFCDQSHMNRAFRAVLGRTPAEVRKEAALLAPLARRL